MTKEISTAPNPTLLPKTKRKENRVWLSPRLWEELSEAAEFHSQVFEVMKADESVSRNDIIESFLMWALAQYWKDKGGKPTSPEERDKKVRRHAEYLERLQEKLEDNGLHK